jgi:hypothetical protein
LGIAGDITLPLALETGYPTIERSDEFEQILDKSLG